MPWCAVAPPFKERASGFEPRFELAWAERVVRAGTQEAPAGDVGVSGQRPGAPEARAGEGLVVRVAGQGVPMRQAEAVQRNATWGPGEKRPRKQAALGGGCSTVEAKPRAPEALAELRVDPAAARARQQRAGTTDEGPRAQPGRRGARLVRPTPAGMERIQAEAEGREPQPRTPVVVGRDGALGRWTLAPQRFKPWKRVTGVLDRRPGVSSLGTAAHALCPEGCRDGQHWGQAQLSALLSGRGGDVSGGRRPILTQRRRRQAGRETLAHVLTGFQHHRRWMKDDA
jgi:hypothetical protein